MTYTVYTYHLCHILSISLDSPQERASYLEYQKLMREIEHLSRLYVAYLFVCAEETKLKSTEDLQEMQSSIAQLQENMKQNEAKVKELSAEIQELERRRDKVSSRQAGNNSVFVGNIHWAVSAFEGYLICF